MITRITNDQLLIAIDGDKMWTVQLTILIAKTAKLANIITVRLQT
jgi:hypothetical protein